MGATLDIAGASRCGGAAPSALPPHPLTSSPLPASPAPALPHPLLPSTHHGAAAAPASTPSSPNPLPIRPRTPQLHVAPAARRRPPRLHQHRRPRPGHPRLGQGRPPRHLQPAVAPVHGANRPGPAASPPVRLPSGGSTQLSPPKVCTSLNWSRRLNYPSPPPPDTPQVYQHVYLAVLYGALAIKSIYVDDFKALAEGSIGSVKLTKLNVRPLFHSFRRSFRSFTVVLSYPPPPAARPVPPGLTGARPRNPLPLRRGRRLCSGGGRLRMRSTCSCSRCSSVDTACRGCSRSGSPPTPSPAGCSPTCSRRVFSLFSGAFLAISGGFPPHRPLPPLSALGAAFSPPPLRRWRTWWTTWRTPSATPRPGRCPWAGASCRWRRRRTSATGASSGCTCPGGSTTRRGRTPSGPPLSTPLRTPCA